MKYPKINFLKEEKKPTSPAKQFLLSKNVLDFPWSTELRIFKRKKIVSIQDIANLDTEALFQQKNIRRNVL